MKKDMVILKVNVEKKTLDTLLEYWKWWRDMWKQALEEIEKEKQK